MIIIVLKILIALGIAIPNHGIVIEKTAEGGTEFNDYYTVNIDGDLYEIESDDLEVNDEVTCYFVNNEEIIWTLYGWR